MFFEACRVATKTWFGTKKAPLRMTHTALSTTSDYYATHFATRLIRAGLHVSQRLWPTLATRMADAMFCTPLPLKWVARRPWLPGDWTVAQWPFERANLTVYSPPLSDRPTVLLIHGWGGHGAQMLPIARKLIADDFNPIVLEMPAHGKSGGMRSSLPQFARAVEYVIARLGEEGRSVYALIAHSLGANASAYAVSRGVQVQRLVLLAPPASPTQYTRLFAHAFALSETTRAAMQRHRESREAIMMRLFEPDAVGPSVTQPTLVVHDRGDRINPFADGEAFARDIPNAQLVATEGLGHRRVLSDAGVLQAVSAFLKA
jgi:pimeloyl-ACP methyl ester carboxylesterase